MAGRETSFVHHVRMGEKLWMIRNCIRLVKDRVLREGQKIMIRTLEH